MPIEQISNSGPVDDLAQDALGSTRLLTDSRGTVVGTTSYSPYGQMTAQSGTVTTPFGFAGQYTDSQTGLVYMRARWYDPATGQFLSVDPLVVATQQPYAYVADNPLNYTDPFGLCGLPQCSLQTIGSMHFGTTYQCPPKWFTGWEVNFLATSIMNVSTLGADSLIQDPAMGTPSAPSNITDFTQHGWTSMLQHNDVGVNFAAMQDAVDNPVDVRLQANGTWRFLGQNATIVLNQVGQVVTGWANHRAGMRYPPEPSP